MRLADTPPDDLGRNLKFSTGGDQAYRRSVGRVHRRVRRARQDARHPLGPARLAVMEENGVERYRVSSSRCRPSSPAGAASRPDCTRSCSRTTASRRMTSWARCRPPRGAPSRKGARLGEGAGDGTDQSTEPNVVEYAVQSMFKGQTLVGAARSTARKLSGHQNMFLGPGVTLVDPKKLNRLVGMAGQHRREGAPQVQARERALRLRRDTSSNSTRSLH